jgi:uncharacterized protein YfaS (alpha-2-macroglobulin family)
MIIPVGASDRGGVGINYAFVKDNRFYSGNHFINVPWANRDLKITYETFRDKTLPGSEEKWKVKITGNRKEKVAAEVLTSIYDASLDQFRPQSWEKPPIYFRDYFQNNWESVYNFLDVSSQMKNTDEDMIHDFQKKYDQLWSVAREMRLVKMTSVAINGKLYRSSIPADEESISGQVVATAFGISKTRNGAPLRDEGKGIASSDSTEIATKLVYSWAEGQKKQDQSAIKIRKNFNETAFFFPDLKTDSSGSVEFSFTMPEAVTEWKWMTFAHTKDLAFGYGEKSIVTQKQLMLQPNLPRFLREGDKIELSTKIVNLTDSEMTGQAELQLFDATTNESVDGLFINREANQYFTAEAKQSVAVNFAIDVPYQFNRPIVYRIIARSKNISDGEEASLPVLSDRMLVTESFPLNMNGSGIKNFKFEKLIQSTGSETLNHHALTVEFTANPSWYAMQALPYLMEYPYECAEQTFNRFYANALASKIISASPRIKQIFQKWKTTDTSAIVSNLQKNQELKSVLLEETPWVLQAKSESQQKKNIALLFDMVRMNNELGSTLGKLQDMQLPDGSFAWFKGGTDDPYITQYILTGIGHLKKMNALPPAAGEKINQFLASTLAYLDKKIKENYEELIRNKANISEDHLDHLQIQYLYMRSFFPEYSVPGESFGAMNYYRKQSQQFWVSQNKYMQAMIALSLFRTGDLKTSKDILASLKQNALISDEIGMYWKEITPGYHWYQSPVETESVLIEAFREVAGDDRSVERMKTWLLKQKQTQSWKTTRATADACYALLLTGADLLAEEKNVQIRMGNTVMGTEDNRTEAGTGYFKKTIDGNFVKPEMGNITVSITPTAGKSTAAQAISSWGAVYWQYFENLDKITPSATPLRVSKKLFVQKNTDRGPVLEPVEDNGVVKIGDKVTVRIELRVDRDMEYLHMKDMRASCMEPVTVLSGYQWQGGLGYYESVKDASTNFFFGWLPKGTYVFEYGLFVTAAGNFSNGITTIQSMYAPEFTSNSEGSRVNTE